MGVEPTKLTAWMVGWARMASTACLSPWTTLKTPSGRPASLSISARRMEALGSRSRGLEDEGVAAGEGDGEHPHGDHGGEVEGRDAGDDAEGLAHGLAVDAGADLFGELAFEEVGDAGGELDDFEAAGGFAAGVGEDFAVLAVEEGGDFVEAALEDLAEAEEDAGAAERRLGGPVGEGCCGGGYGGVDFGDRWRAGRGIGCGRWRGGRRRRSGLTDLRWVGR